MKQPIFTGSGVAIVTPFNDKGIDFDKLGELIEWHIAEGTDAIIICGTTGEAPTLPIEDHKEAIRYTVDKVAKRIPVIAGAGSNDTVHAIGTSRFAASAGADAILSVVPYYNKPSQKGIYTHFKTIASNVDLPIMLYNVPSRTVASLQPSTVKALSAIDNIVAIKECDFSHVGEILALCPDLDVYSGDDANILPVLALGGKGIISVMANVIPKDTHRLCQHFFDGNIEASRAIQLKTLPLIKALFSEASPAPTKEALNMLGYAVGDCRLPITPMETATQQLLKEALIGYGILPAHS